MSRSQEIILYGTVVYGEDFELMDGYVCLRDGLIREVGEGKIDYDVEGLICPCFVNAHTHIADSVFKDPPFMSLKELVGPGGLKHHVLTHTSKEMLVEGMRRTLYLMKATGTFAFADFREGGNDGVNLLLDALKGISLEAKIMGRPHDSYQEITNDCWGLGISSTRDYDFWILRDLVKAARARKQTMAIHAGEVDRDDIFEALSLEPDFLVHVCEAEMDDLKMIAAQKIPVVICPRSNLITGIGLPDLKGLIQMGITVGVGTDNTMLNSPDMFSEMELICKALLHDDRQVFKMCTLNGAKILGIDRRLGSISEGKEGRVMVVDRKSDNMWGSSNLLASLVRRARPSDILAVF